MSAMSPFDLIGSHELKWIQEYEIIGHGS